MAIQETKELRGLAPADFLQYAETNEPDLMQVSICPTAKVFATAMANLSGKSVEQEIANVISDWAKGKQAEAIRFVDAYNKEFEQRKKQPEKEVERFIVEQLASIGVRAASQVKCSAGVADIVTEQCVIEVKPAIRNMRDANRAMGQALAYAKAIGRPGVIVCAMEISNAIDRKNVMHGALVSASCIALHFMENGLA